MRKWILIGISAAFFLGACSLISQSTIPMNNGYNNFPQQSGFASNGQQIYFTAIDQNGQRISYTGGLTFGGMMSSYLTCAACHGADAHGGTHYIHMQTLDTPAINYDALIQMKQKDSGGSPTNYSLNDFRAAVVEGRDTAGDQLDQNMPRWQMNDQDLQDLLDYLKTLP